MPSRPQRTIPLSQTDKLIEAFTIVLLTILWIGTIAGYASLPEQIAIHFNVDGEVDNYSEKSYIFILPILTTIIYLGMTVLNKYPHKFNYLTTVTEENAMRLYTYATKFIRVGKLMIVILFTVLVYTIFNTSRDADQSIGPWFVPISVILIIMPVIFYLWKGFKQREI